MEKGKRSQGISDFCRKTDFVAKLKATLENIQEGNGHAVFEGLQSGQCTVSIKFDGTTVSLANIPRGIVRPEVKAKEEAKAEAPANPETPAPAKPAAKGGKQK